MQIALVAIAGWVACGSLARAACIADYVGDIGERWGPPRWLRLVLFIGGPITLLAAASATANPVPGVWRRPFYHGFRFSAKAR